MTTDFQQPTDVGYSRQGSGIHLGTCYIDFTREELIKFFNRKRTVAKDEEDEDIHY